MKNFKDQMALVTLIAKPRRNGKTLHHDSGEKLWEFNMPRWQFEERVHTIHWITARFQYLNPDKYIKISTSFYFKTGEDFKLTMRIRSQKGQVTKIKNNMALARKAFRPNLLISSIEETELWQKAEIKLLLAEEKLANLERELREVSKP